MNNITFFGDLVAREVAGLHIGEELKNLIHQAEFSVINFEAPIENNYDPIPKAGPNNTQSKLAPKWAIDNGFNIFSFANNHSLDFGEQALIETMNCFTKDSIMGAGNWSDAYKPMIVKLSNGKTVGIISGTHKEFGTLSDTITQKETKGTAWLFHPLITETIIETRKNVDYLYVYAHGGVEFLEQPLPEWRSAFKHFINLGCDGVICSHPHIPMGWEFYKGKPIIYSLGNFCFQKPMVKPENLRYNWNNSLCCEISFSEDLPQIKIYPINYNIYQNRIEISDSKDYKEYLLKVNQTLNNMDLYEACIEKDIRLLYHNYMNMLGIKIQHKSLKSKFKSFIIKCIYRQRKHTMVESLNAIQCESHRWFIQRAIKNQI